MSDAFEERQNAFEAKYAHDEELKFKLHARTSRLFGTWVAEQLGLTGADNEAYAKTVVDADLEEAGFDDVLRKVKKDLDEKGLNISDHHLKVELQRCMDEAQKQLAG